MYANPNGGAALRPVAALSLLAVAMCVSASVFATVGVVELPQCGQSGVECSYSVEFNGQILGPGTYEITETGARDVLGSAQFTAKDGSLKVTDVSSSADPTLTLKAEAHAPEPSTYALMAAGLAFIAFVARRRLNA